jgi:hypothetical protein
MLAKASSAAYYFGYWQNEAYFLPIQDIVRQEFTLRTSPSESVMTLMDEITRCRSVSLHVRRYNDIGADGRVILKAQNHHGVCDIEYFHQALDVIGREPGTVCYIFSDDPAWARMNLKPSVSCQYMADLCRCSDAEEMALMASCQHHVIANSSFGWWGAWLGRNPKKVVVAPKIWMRSIPESAVDICPRTWIRL